MSISLKSAKMLWGRAAGHCSLAICRQPLVLDETEHDSCAVIGDMCHIVAQAEDGPRGRASLSAEERDSYSNLILLCRNHHAEIDNQPAKWPVERLRRIKSEHEQWVREQLPGFDQQRQSEDEIYAGYVEEWSKRCYLENWKGWGSFVLGSGQPRMTVEMDKGLEELRGWLLDRIWPGRHEKLEAAFENFRQVLQDFQETFRERAEKPTPDNEWLFTVKFYQIDEWNEERYWRLSRLYDFHVDLVGDLFLELTRAANLVCDEARAAILPSFRHDKGHLTAEWGPVMPDARFIEAVVRYSAKENAAAERPYPGLKAFKIVRETRDRSFGQGAAP